MASIKKWVVRRMSSSGNSGQLGRMASLVGGDEDRRTPRRTVSTGAAAQTRRPSRAALRKARHSQKKRQSFVFEGGKSGAIQSLWDGSGSDSPNSSAELTEPTFITLKNDSLDTIESTHVVSYEENEEEQPQSQPQPQEIVWIPPQTKELRWHTSVDEQLEEKRLRLLQKPSKVPQFRMTKKQLIFEFPTTTTPEDDNAVTAVEEASTAPPSFRVMDDSMSSVRAVNPEDKVPEGQARPNDAEEEDDTSRTSDDSDDDDDDSDVDSIGSSSSSSETEKSDSDVYLTDEDLTDGAMEREKEEEELGDSQLNLDLYMSSLHTMASF